MDLETAVASDTPPLLPHLQQQVDLQEPLVMDDAAGTNYEEEAQKLEEKALRFLAKQTHPVVVPSFAAWFDPSKVHEIEKRSLPDFFDDSSRFKTEKAYRDTRNFMLNTYRLSPYEYLTITAVRRNIAMDVASIVKIHSFLETWGLINYQIDPRTKPALIGPSFTGHFQLVLDTPQGLKPFLPRNQEESNPGQDVVDGKEEEDGRVKVEVKSEPHPINLSLRKNVYDSSQDFNVLHSQSRNSRQIQKLYICHTCGNDTVLIRYHNLRAKDANLCSRCFQEGHFGGNFQASDFIRLENNNIKSTQWSDQEVLLLLEGIEMYEDQWDLIQDHVGGQKSVEDCVEKFLTLPIEDNYINEVVKSKLGGKDTDFKRGATLTTHDTVNAVDLAIKSLLDGLHKEVLEESIPESAKHKSTKYLQEAQAIVQELVSTTIEKLTSKFDKLDVLESTLEAEKNKYVKESERILNDRIMLSKQINELNTQLASMNVSKKLVLVSDQVEAGIELVEKDEEDDSEEQAAKLQKLSQQEVEALSVKEPQVYKPWSL
ncbi:Rsc8p KNAG_0L01250 [Huiozyma naganishii CBS 8797]|uniref:SWIRM domain-containing protein n=1 Tax=Huiozyma naganishii (strain ATCC MYA-139 / BCRC 22969 / CBS 8797 / KCTC 17520 / NBRC 10181 / NCYC 3082 / Yp74L-3) TaxID=1071383 RepID=J7RCY7_HUIN7|nr:hypothetical protein KNAG_0L01250 [Kazachstania naganishii CBS 8797]CCK72745.1 hypothetical protein KNAG_0L01250 [Kazachstania naganishii CBS 8797]